MVDHAPSVFNPPKQLARLDKGAKDEEEPSYDVAFEENGFSYGAGPIPPSVYDNPVGNQSTEFVTPAPRRSREKSHRERHGSPGLNRNDSITSTGDKKRKRGHVDEIDPSVANASRFEDDTPMTDAPSSMIVNASTPALNHSGLTGGLGRMMRDYTPDYPDYHSDVDYDDDDRYQDPVSPIKRTRRADKESISSNNNSTDNGLGISIKGRTGRIMSLLGGTSGVTSIATVAVNNNDAASRTLVRTRRRSTEGIHVRKQKKHRVRQVESHKSKRRTSGSNAVPVGGGGSNGLHLDTDSDSQQPRRLKAIEYHRRSSHSDSEPRSRSPRNSKSRNTENQLVVYKRAGDDEDAAPLELVQKEKASGFLSLVTKGPDSERGISMHKALKRYHREFPALFSSLMDRDNNGSEGKERGRGRGRGKERGGSVDKDRKSDEEKDLWRALRLKRNDRGEIVVFI
ncbi:hypothetical protein AJ80_09669 [Polytolypa hystricis UAMH7299]|uniref:Uncharacterized protein n=1 Tax=Polytolypa hystricis (strain UAMH7299) TaxID=1447883 RepID=A0A2B7WLU2_POLH7|nr:hypothetical protein AJ80_09669 [Polytolypa hystricis UAMH7299]